MLIVCLTCNITLPRRRGSRPDGARFLCNSDNMYMYVYMYIPVHNQNYMYNMYTTCTCNV